MRPLLLLVAIVVGLQGWTSSASLAASLEELLSQGRLAEAEADLEKSLADDPSNGDARLSLSVVQLVRAVERLEQSLYRFGFNTPTTTDILLFHAVHPPIAENPTPQRIAYKDFRGIIERLRVDLGHVEETLTPLGEKRAKACLRVGRIRLDFTGEGKPPEDWQLWKLHNSINPWQSVTAQEADEYVICFDNTDAEWLRGYCHLLMAACETALAHDMRELFERTGHLFFKQVDSPHDFLADGRRVMDFWGTDLLDSIAYIHLMNFECTDPPGMARALVHLEAAIQRSRAMWKSAVAETDDDREWIPNPSQQGAIRGMRITPEMVTGWNAILDEAEAILKGRKLIPFWRANDMRGINVRRVFTDPRRFDLVLWVQGTGATPYLENGELSNPNAWQQWQGMFGGRLFNYAVWFN